MALALSNIVLGEDAHGIVEAEQRDHHPEIFNCWNRVDIALNTHSAGGKVTAKDIDLATAIEALGK